MVNIQRIDARQTNEKHRTCAYCRVSTAFDSQTGSYEAQKAYYTAYIQSNPKWCFAGIYADEGVSATGMEKRAGFLQMLADCKRGRIDRIIVKSVSRFARNTLDCLQTVRMLQAIGVTVFFETENMDTASSQSEVLLTALGAAAQEEAAIKSQNMKWRNNRNYPKGQYIQSTMPYGYRVLAGQPFVPHPAQASVIRQIFKDYLKGMGYSKIAGNLNNQGVPAPKAGAWSGQTVKNILLNERYIGDRLLQKSFTEETTYGRKRNNGEKKQYYISGSHEPLIDAQDFYRVQALMKKKHSKNTEKKDHPLKGKIICGLCGKNCWIQSVKKNNSTAHYWYCGNATRHSDENPRVHEKDLAAAFWHMAVKLKEDDAVLLKRLHRDLAEAENGDEESNPHRINEALLTLFQQQQALYQRRLAQEMDAVILMDEMSALENQIAGLKKKRKNPISPEEEREAAVKSSQTLALIKVLDNNPITHPQNGPIDIPLFLQIVDNTTVYPRDEIQFFLKNGLVISERTR